MAKKLKDILEGTKGQQENPTKPRKSRAKQIIELVREVAKTPYIDEIFITTDGHNYQKLDENRKWVSGRFERNIGIDQPTSGAGKTHGHVLGRKGNEMLVVNYDGSGSHGTKGRLHVKDAAALKKAGFDIPDDRIIEWTVIGKVSELLLE